MADNRWQMGLYGNKEDATDEEIRQYILAVQTEHNLTPSQAIKHIITVHMHAYANAYAVEDAPLATAQADNSDVIETLQSGFAMLADKLDSLGTIPRFSVASHEAPVGDTQTGEETPEQAEDRLIAEGMSPAALVVLKTRVFQQGMRMDD